MPNTKHEEALPDYRSIAAHYEQCLERYGSNHMGMDWPNLVDLKRRFSVMLGVVSQSEGRLFSLLDVGCGVGLLLDYIKDSDSEHSCAYTGLDISEQMVHTARQRHPETPFVIQDIIASPLPDSSYDYIVMNGVLTEKVSLSQADMEAYAKRIIVAAFNAASKGIAFNIMSSHVDWERDELFHWPLDEAVGFMVKACSRNIVVRMDYGLYEYTVYLYKEPTHGLYCFSAWP
jgi:SAM-dependent methyltransferase